MGARAGTATSHSPAASSPRHPARRRWQDLGTAAEGAEGAGGTVIIVVALRRAEIAFP